MKIRVMRGLGDKEKSGVLVNELCTNTAVGTEYGKAYLYSEGFDKKIYDITTFNLTPLTCGNIVEISDVSLGEVFKTRVTSFSIVATFNDDSGLNIEQNLIVERSVDG